MRTAVRSIRHLSCAAVAAALGALAAPPATAQSEALGHHGSVWNLGTQESGRSFPTDVTARNVNCRGERTFEVSVEGEAADFLSIVGPTRLEGIARGESRTTPARLDLTGIPAGVYNEGRIVIRCVDCPPKCRPHITTLDIHLTVRAPEGEAAGPPASAPDDPGRGADAGWDPDDYEFLPHVDYDWGTGEAPGDGRHRVEVTKLAGASIATASDDDASTRVRDLCLESTGPCDELLARVREAEGAARVARARADDAARDEAWDASQAAAIEDEIASDRAQIATLRRQAADWRQLAADARADAATNRARAERQPEYRDSWLREAASDEHHASERDARAQRLEEEADRLERGIRDDQQEADDLRGRAERLKRAAEAAEEALRLAREAYEECLERQRLECERRRREEIRRAQAAAAAASASPSTAPSTASTPAGSPSSGGGRGFLPNYESLPVKTAPYCEWVRYNVPYGATVDFVAVRGSSRRDTPSAIEVRRMDSGTSSTGRGFDYHCKATTGSAVIVFHLSEGGTKRYKMRVGCIE